MRPAATFEKMAHKRPEPQTFPLSPGAVEVLKTWHQQQDEPAAGYVFPSPKTGERYDYTAIGSHWRRVKAHTVTLAREKRIDRALPDDLELYSLRHNFVSQLIMKGADLLAVSRLMGHSDITTTITHYGHLAPDHKRDVVTQFGSRRGGLARGRTVAGAAQGGGPTLTLTRPQSEADSPPEAEKKGKTLYI